MPLKILQHKSFHVYNRENIEKVRRDEAKAKVLEDQEEQRMIAADSEARLSLLRKRSRRESKSKQDISFEEIARPEIEHTGHINFWEDYESGKVSTLGNAEYQAEKTAEKRKNEDAFTMYLDKPAKEMKPWYSQPDMIASGERELSDRKKRVREQTEEKALSMHDPMTTMNELLNKRKEARKAQAFARDRSSSPVTSSAYNGQYNPDATRSAHRHHERSESRASRSGSSHAREHRKHKSHRHEPDAGRSHDREHRMRSSPTKQRTKRSKDDSKNSF